MDDKTREEWKKNIPADVIGVIWDEGWTSGCQTVMDKILAVLDAKIAEKRHYRKSTQKACGKDDMDTQWMIGKVEALRELRAEIEGTRKEVG